MDEDAKSKFLPDSEYQRVGSVNFAKMSENQAAFADLYLREVN